MCTKFPQESDNENFINWSTFAEVTMKSQVYCFFSYTIRSLSTVVCRFPKLEMFNHCWGSRMGCREGNSASLQQRSLQRDPETASNHRVRGLYWKLFWLFCVQRRGRNFPFHYLRLLTYYELKTFIWAVCKKLFPNGQCGSPCWVSKVIKTNNAQISKKGCKIQE